MSTGYLKFAVEIKGDALLQHNGRLADPLDAASKRLKHFTGVKKKTDEVHAAVAEAEFRGSLYLNTDGQVILPSRVLEANIAEGARKTKEGKNALAGLFVDEDAILSYDGGPMTEDQLVASPAHRLTVGVRVKQARVMRTRPLFRNWSAKFQVSVLSTVITEEALGQWLQNAGTYLGLGDYRPRYGRYDLVSLVRA